MPNSTQITDPPTNCSLCDRLVAYRCDNEAAYPEYFNAPAPSFGPANSALLIVGLAPGVHGANRTGRPFTGDYAGDLLYATLNKFGFANDRFRADPKDGLKLFSAMVTNAVRCVPPQNKPVAAEIHACRPFLINQIDALKQLKAIVCLGRIAHDSTLAALGMKSKDAPFGHGAVHSVPSRGITLFDSYHCSRYNTNTRRLTPEMFESVFAAVRDAVDKS